MKRSGDTRACGRVVVQNIRHPIVPNSTSSNYHNMFGRESFLSARLGGPQWFCEQWSAEFGLNSSEVPGEWQVWHVTPATVVLSSTDSCHYHNLAWRPRDTSDPSDCTCDDTKARSTMYRRHVLKALAPAAHPAFRWLCHQLSSHRRDASHVWCKVFAWPLPDIQWSPRHRKL